MVSPSSKIFVRLPFIPCGQLSITLVMNSSAPPLFWIVILTCLDEVERAVTVRLQPMGVGVGVAVGLAVAVGLGLAVGVGLADGHGFAGELCRAVGFGAMHHVPDGHVNVFVVEL